MEKKWSVVVNLAVVSHTNTKGNENETLAKTKNITRGEGK